MRRHAKAPTAGSTMRHGSRLGRTVRGAFVIRDVSREADGSGARSTGRTHKGLFGLLCCSMVFAVWAAGAGAALPDGRGYELVSPAAKAGGSIIGHTHRTRAAADGSGSSFISLTAFGDAIGTGVEVEYVARRQGAPGTQGWVTHAITPRQDPLPFDRLLKGFTPHYPYLSPYLTTGIFKSWSPLTDAPEVAAFTNLYLRDDLQTPGEGTFSLLTGCPACNGTPLATQLGTRQEQPFFAGASAGLDQVAFESNRNLTGAGGTGPKVYVSDGGVVRLAGLVPSGSDTSCGGAGPACILPTANGGTSLAGLGATPEFNLPRVISESGSRVNFSAPATGAGIVTTGFFGNRTKLYQRDSHGTPSTADDTTVKINVSERTVPVTSDAAGYETASTDGTRVFFQSAEALTDDAIPGLKNIYMWDSDTPNDEVQRLTVAASGGTFTLTLDGETTSALPFDASPAAIEAALEALPAVIGAGGAVEVSGGPGDDAGAEPYTVTFAAGLSGSDLPLMTADATLLTGTAPAATVDPRVRGGGHLTVINRDEDPGDAPAAADGVIGASEDGSHVYFLSRGQLVAGEPLLSAENRRGIYLWHDGDIRYIGNFAPALGEWSRNMPIRSGRGGTWQLDTMPSRVTPDGRGLMFVSIEGSGLTGYDHSTTGCSAQGGQACTEFYVYDADTDVLACATCNPTGAPATADATTSTRFAATLSANTGYQNRSLSDDGRRVFFTSGEALVPEDTNGKRDAYVYDVPTDTISLLSSGKSPFDSYFMDASANGDDAFFITRERLVGWDFDTSYDLYDARVGGGLPEPVPPPAGCSGDACQGPSGAPPAALSGGSASLVGPGNAKPKRQRARKLRCGKNKRKARRSGKTRCVRKKNARSHKRNANRNRRTSR